MTCPNPCYSDYSYNGNYYYNNPCSTSSSYCYEDPCMPRRRCQVINRPSVFEYLFTPTCPTYSSSWYQTCPRVVRREPASGAGAVLMLVIFLIMGVLSLANNPKHFYY